MAEEVLSEAEREQRLKRDREETLAQLEHELRFLLYVRKPIDKQVDLIERRISAIRQRLEAQCRANKSRGLRS